MQDATKKKIRRTVAGTLAAVLAISSTFAWRSLSGEGVNEFWGSDKLDVKLVEDFETPKDWKPGQEANKDVSVKNDGDTPLYVRVKLSEYMEQKVYTYHGFKAVGETVTDENGNSHKLTEAIATRFALNKDGEFILMNEGQDDDEYSGPFTASNGDVKYAARQYDKSQVKYVSNPADGVKGWYLLAAGADFDGQDYGENADNTNANGQIGAWMPVKANTSTVYPLDYTTKHPADTDGTIDRSFTDDYDVFEYSTVVEGMLDGSAVPTGTEATAHVATSWDWPKNADDPNFNKDDYPGFDASAKGTTGGSNIIMHDYVQWNMGVDENGDRTVMTMAEWVNGGSKPGNYWVLDTDGWAYWANPLYPEDPDSPQNLSQTTKLLDSVTLVTAPGHNEDAGEAGGEFFYTIHAQLDAATKEQITKWTVGGTDSTAQPAQETNKNDTTTEAGKNLIEIVTGVEIEDVENKYIIDIDGDVMISDPRPNRTVTGSGEVTPIGNAPVYDAVKNPITLTNSNPDVATLDLSRNGDDGLSVTENPFGFVVTWQGVYGQTTITATANGADKPDTQTIYFTKTSEDGRQWIIVKGTEDRIWQEVVDNEPIENYIDGGADSMPGGAQDYEVFDVYYNNGAPVDSTHPAYQYDGTDPNIAESQGVKDGFLTKSEKERFESGEEILPDGVVKGEDGNYYRPYPGIDKDKGMWQQVDKNGDPLPENDPSLPQGGKPDDIIWQGPNGEIGEKAPNDDVRPMYEIKVPADTTEANVSADLFDGTNPAGEKDGYLTPAEKEAWENACDRWQHVDNDKNDNIYEELDPNTGKPVEDQDGNHHYVDAGGDKIPGTGDDIDLHPVDPDAQPPMEDYDKPHNNDGNDHGKDDGFLTDDQYQEWTEAQKNTLLDFRWTGTAGKTSYKEGESFSPEGLTFEVVFANDPDNWVEISADDVKFEPTPLGLDTEKVTPSYTSNGKTLYADPIAVTVLGKDVQEGEDGNYYRPYPGIDKDKGMWQQVDKNGNPLPENDPSLPQGGKPDDIIWQGPNGEIGEKAPNDDVRPMYEIKVPADTTEANVSADLFDGTNPAGEKDGYLTPAEKEAWENACDRWQHVDNDKNDNIYEELDPNTGKPVEDQDGNHHYVDAGGDKIPGTGDDIDLHPVDPGTQPPMEDYDKPHNNDGNDHGKDDGFLTDDQYQEWETAKKKTPVELAITGTPAGQIPGDLFNASGLTFEVVYADGHKETVPSADVKNILFNKGENLTDDMTSVTAEYKLTVDGKEYTVSGSTDFTWNTKGIVKGKDGKYYIPVDKFTNKPHEIYRECDVNGTLKGKTYYTNIHKGADGKIGTPDDITSGDTVKAGTAEATVSRVVVLNNKAVLELVGNNAYFSTVTFAGGVVNGNANINSQGWIFGNSTQGVQFANELNSTAFINKYFGDATATSHLIARNYPIFSYNSSTGTTATQKTPYKMYIPSYVANLSTDLTLVDRIPLTAPLQTTKLKTILEQERADGYLIPYANCQLAGRGDRCWPLTHQCYTGPGKYANTYKYQGTHKVAYHPAFTMEYYTGIELVS